MRPNIAFASNFMVRLSNNPKKEKKFKKWKYIKGTKELKLRYNNNNKKKKKKKKKKKDIKNLLMMQAIMILILKLYINFMFFFNY